MTVPVWIEQQNGHFTATVLGAPGMHASASSREKAIEALRVEVETRLSAGELLLLGVEPKGLGALAGRYASDDVSRQAWNDVVAEAYRQREELKAREFPE